MSIENIKRKNGYTYRAVSCRNHVRISKTFHRKFDAQRWLEEQTLLTRSGFKCRLSFSEAADVWLNNHSQIKKSPASYIDDKVRVERYFKPSFVGLDLDEVTPERVESFIAKIHEGRKNATINRFLECLSAIFSYYVRKRYILTNPVSIVGKLPRMEVSYDFLGFEEADRFLSHTNRKYQKELRWIHRLYLTALNTGMRWGEIRALQWDAVDFYHNQITVRRTYCTRSRQIRETTKGRSIRHLGINSCLKPELLAHKDKSHNDLVFPGNGKGLNLCNFKRDHFEKDLREAGIRRIRFHDLRHTFASHFVMRSGSLYDLQKLLGHQSIRMTERYAHLSHDSVVSKTELVAIDGGEGNLVPTIYPQKQKAPSIEMLSA